MQDENQDEQPVEEPKVEETTEEVVEEEFVPDDPEKVEQAEKILREANLARVRGHASVADRLLKEASELAPNTPSVLEAIGDDFIVRGQFRRAKEAYGKAHKIDPKNVTIENKYGEMVLKVDLHIDPFTYADEFSGYANSKMATILSLLCAGLGQFAVERYTKGWIMLGAWALSWIANWLMPGGLKALTKFAQGTGPFEPVGVVLLGISIGITLWSVFDLTTLKHKAPKKVDSPVPPSEWMNR